MGKKKERQQKNVKAQELYNAGRSSEAAEMLWSCLNLYALKEKESREYAVLHCSLGAALAESGQLKSARLHFMEALNIFNALGEIRDAAMVEFNLGNVYKYAGSWQAAYNHYNAALSLYERLDDHSGIALVLLALGHFFSEVGFGAQVESYLDRLSQFKEYIEKDLTSLWSYVMLCSNLESMKGNISKSLELAKAALEHAKRLGNASYVAETEGSISENLRRLGRTELASDFAQRAYEFAKTTSDRQVIENTYQLALAVTEAGDKDKTIALYEECLTLIDQQRSQLDGAERYLLMGRLSEVGQKYVDFLANIHDAKRAFKVTERVQARTLLDLMFRHQIKRQGGRVIRAGKNGRITLGVPSLTDIVSSIREDDIHVLKFFFTSDKLLGWLLKPDGALEMWDASGAEQHYNKLLSQLPSSSFLSAAQTVSHSEIENGITQLQVNAPLSKERSQWSDVSTTLRDLYVELFPGEVRQYLETHQGKLVVIPHWSMFEIPFFPLGPDNDKPLGTRWQISMVPSMGVFLQLDRRRDSREDTRNFSRGLNALIVGDCGAQTVAIPAYPLAEEDKYFLVAFCHLPC